MKDTISAPVIISRDPLTATLFCGDCLDFQFPVGKCDAVITDPPFSERTHSGHDASARGHSGEGHDNSKRRHINYECWSDTEMEKFCTDWQPDGWTVILTDHTLARVIENVQGDLGRYVFAPIPSYTPGRSVRLSGDGPSSWTDWIVVSRTSNQVRWGTLPGGYINVPERTNGSHMGGKPVNLMAKLVQDYSRPGMVVCDPCMGGGTTGIACLRTNRNFIGIEKDPAHFAVAVERIEREARQGVLW